MTKTELKEAKERYFMLSKMIKETTSKSLVKESVDEQQERIKRLLKPENYVDFFDYYFGVNSGMPLADAPSSKFHQSSYEKVFNDRKIRQFRMWFRGAAKSLHTNVGNILHLKENQELFFAVLITISLYSPYGGLYNSTFLFVIFSILFTLNFISSKFFSADNLFTCGCVLLCVPIS